MQQPKEKRAACTKRPQPKGCLPRRWQQAADAETRWQKQTCNQEKPCSTWAAQALKSAGVQAAYHAHRLGEGEITAIPPARRIATLEHIRAAGLKVMSAVEPVHSGTSPKAIIERMEKVASFEPYCAGVGTLTSVKGTPMEGIEPISRAKGALLAAVFRLMVGEDIPFGTGGGNVVWSDAGTTPRARNLPVDAIVLERDVARLKKELRGKEWGVPDRPLASWF